MHHSPIATVPAKPPQPQRSPNNPPLHPQGACLANGSGGRWGRNQRHGESKSGFRPQQKLSSQLSCPTPPNGGAGAVAPASAIPLPETKPAQQALSPSLPNFLPKSLLITATILLLLSTTKFAHAQPLPTTWPSDNPPTTWIDSDTGHRVRRLTSEPDSTGLYFNYNAYTPDGKEMVYVAPDGIHILNLDSLKTRLLVPGDLKVISVGRSKPGVYYLKNTKPPTPAVFYADINTGESKQVATLPPRGSVASVNADETLVAGTYIEGSAGLDYGEQRVMPPGMSGNLVQPLNKAQMMADRLAAHLPLVLFTVNLQTGEQKPLLHSTDWVNHLLFSPIDPTLLMYCHEGPWQQVDRIWNIRTDATHNQLIHKRTMAMEIAGHEFWGIDGKTIWYDLQTPKGEDFFLASYNLETAARRWYHMQRNEWSIHFNVTADESLICGDGGDPGQVAKAPDGQWIELFHPDLIRNSGQQDPTFIQPGVLHSEHLVNMSKHNYKLEPNVRFSPDNKTIIFSSNMLGPSYVFAVDVEKSDATP